MPVAAADSDGRERWHDEVRVGAGGRIEPREPRHHLLVVLLDDVAGHAVRVGLRLVPLRGRGAEHEHRQIADGWITA